MFAGPYLYLNSQDNVVTSNFAVETGFGSSKKGLDGNVMIKVMKLTNHAVVFAGLCIFDNLKLHPCRNKTISVQTLSPRSLLHDVQISNGTKVYVDIIISCMVS